MSQAFQSLAQKTSSNMDHQYGRVLLINGHTFYSPNCQRAVALPPPPTRPSTLRKHRLWYPPRDEREDKQYALDDILPPLTRDASRHDVSEFYQPRWWTEEYTHLAFMPLAPIVSGLLEPIFSTPAGRYFIKDVGYTLNSTQTIEWGRLEFDILEVIKMLLGRIQVKQPPQIIRTAIVSTSRRSYAEFMQAMTRSRNWYKYWLCRLSFAIAVNITVDGEDAESRLMETSNGRYTFVVPRWYKDLSKAEHSNQLWHQQHLSTVHAAAGNFNPSIERAGVFLNLINPARGQFSPDWFCSFNIPVWYPWGDAEVVAVNLGKLSRSYAPPPHLLQALASASIPISPTKLDFNPESVLPYKCHRFEVHSSRDQFFEARRLEVERALQRMSSKEFTSYQDRTKNPSKKHCYVYLWVGHGDLHYRVQIASIGFSDAFEEYRQHHRKFEALHNTWDLCKEFRECTPEPYSSDDDSDFHDHAGGDYDMFNRSVSPELPAAYPGTPGPSPFSPDWQPMDSDDLPAMYPGTPGPLPHSPDSPHSDNQIDVEPAVNDRFDPEYRQMDALEVLYEYFGFVAPLPLIRKPNSSIPSPQNIIKYDAVLGRAGKPDNAFYNSEYGAYVVSFLQCLDLASMPLATTSTAASHIPARKAVKKVIPARKAVKKVNPEDDVWDLRASNRLSLFTSPYLHALRKISSDLFIFDFGPESAVHWKIAVFDASVALLVCRLDNRCCDRELALCLLQRGIGFSTLLPCKFSSIPRPPMQILPVCLDDKRQFTTSDYDVYFQSMVALLANPRIARAGLLKGGIIWRLVKHILSMNFSTVLVGPTLAATSGQIGTVYAIEGFGLFCDDMISEREMDILCGTTIVMTGPGGDCMLKSWWPRSATWDSNIHHPHWTERDENRFQVRLAEISGGEAQPRSSAQWKSFRESGVPRRISQSISRESNDFIDRYHQAQ